MAATYQEQMDKQESSADPQQGHGGVHRRTAERIHAGRQRFWNGRSLPGEKGKRVYLHKGNLLCRI